MKTRKFPQIISRDKMRKSAGFEKQNRIESTFVRDKSAF